MPAQAPSFDHKRLVGVGRLRGLWLLLSGYRPLYVGATLAIGLAAASRTAFYYLIRYFTDDVLGQAEARGQLPWVAAGFLGLALIQGGFTYLSGRWAAAAAEGIARRLRDYLYDHIQRLTFAYHDRTPAGDLIQRVTSDVDALRRFFQEQALGVGRITLLFLINFTALVTLNARLALVSVVLIPIVLGTSVLFFRKISALYEAFQEQEAKLSTTLQENLTGIRVVRAFARQQFEVDKFEADNWERFARGRRLLLMHAYFWPSTDILVGIQLLIGYTIGARMAIAGTITVGTFLAYLGLLAWIIWPMRYLGRLIVDLSTGIVSFQRVAAIIEQQREPIESGRHEPDGPLRGEIVFEDVAFAYEDGAPVLQDITFHVAAGQSVALLGSTGSGKTSLVNLLLRFYDYSAGHIALDGVELRDYAPRALRRAIGLVQQEPFLFSRTIRDNITYGVERPVSDEEVAAVARAAAIHDVIEAFTDGYNTLVGERGVTLSGGQKQRVTLARTLLKDPRILILDDATSSVDTETEAAIRDALAQLLPGRTSFIIAHRIQTVMHADLILVLDGGRIVQHGRHAALIAEDGPYREIFELQSRIEEELEQDLAGALEQGLPAAAPGASHG